MNSRNSFVFLLCAAVSLCVLSGCTGKTRISAIEATPAEVRAGAAAEVKIALENPPSDPSILQFQWLAERGSIEPRIADATPSRQYVAPETPGVDRITVNLFASGKLLDVKSATLTVIPGPSIGAIEVTPQEVRAGDAAEVNVEIQNPSADTTALRLEGTAQRGTIQPLAPEAPLSLRYIAPLTPGEDTIQLQLFSGNVRLDEKSVLLNVAPGPTIGDIEITPERVQVGRTAIIRVKVENPPADASALRLFGAVDFGSIRSSTAEGPLSLQYVAPLTPGEARITLLLYSGEELLDERLIYAPITPGPTIRAISVFPEEAQAGGTAEARVEVQNPPLNPGVLRIEGAAERGKFGPSTSDAPLTLTYIAPPESGEDRLTIQLLRGNVLLDEQSFDLTITPAYILLEGFEGFDAGWKSGSSADYPDAPGALTGKRTRDEVAATEGEYTYCMELDATRGDAVFEFLPQPPMDLSEYAALTLDIYTPDPQVGVALAISTSANWLWHESEIRRLSRLRDWNPLVFDLTAETYKVGSGGWENPIRDINNVQRIAVKIYGQQFTGPLYMDNIRLIKAERRAP